MGPGDQIGSYTILSMLGGGAMSIVYLAEDGSTKTQVALKELRQQYVFDRQLVDRFIRGATVLKDLRHPHLARVFDWFEQDGRFYTVEEYLSGGSVAQLLEKSAPDQTTALTWCRDALRALNYVHEFGIVHRDLKPSNLMLDANGQIRVIDFGIARVFGDIRLTRTGDGSIGTPWYMSPEQIRTPGEVDHLTDVYSAGVVLYELLTGKVPFDATTQFAIQEKIIRQAPPSMRALKPELDPALEKIVLKALEKDPKKRHGGCGEFALAIDRYLNGKSSGATSAWARRAVEQIVSPVRRAPRAAVAAMIVVTLLLTGIVAMAVRPPAGGGGGGTTVTRAIRVTGSVEPPAVSEAGTTVTFAYQVTNPGDVALNHVTVGDGGSTPPFLAGGDTNRNGSLDVDETWRFESRLTIAQANLDSGSLVRHAVASSDQALSEPIDVQLQLRGRAGIAISMLVNGTKSAQLTAPGAVTYTYVVSNTGNVALTGVHVTDTQGATPLLRRGDINGNNVLEAGERWEYRSSVTVTAARFAGDKPLVSRAVVASDQLRSESDEVTLTLIRPVRPDDGTVPPPRKAKDVRPEYPPEAREAGIQGDVRLEVTIDVGGRVQDVRVLAATATSPTGPATARFRDALIGAALAAARQWEYAPTVLNGTAVPVIIAANVRFVLTPGPQPVRAGGNIRAPIKTHDVAPTYPAIAQAARVQGVVILEVTLDPSGRVRDGRILRSIPLLDQAALDAVRQWEFTPTILNGVAVPIIMTVTVQFTLN